MLDFTLETQIDRPADSVFAYITDPDRLSSWQTNTVSCVQEGDGPLGLGTRVRLRAFGEVGGLKRLLLAPMLKRQFTGQLATLKSVLEQLDPVAERIG